MKILSPYLCFLLACFMLSYLSSGADGISTNSTIQCIDQERAALLKFKEGIEFDNCSLMSSWGNHSQPDCCTWHGVTCSNHTRHVISLDLPGVGVGSDDGCLRGKLGPSLFELKHLSYLDLSFNHLHWISTPAERHDDVAGLCSLQRLDLSYNNLTTEIFSIIQPLTACAYTKLEYLSLASNQLQGTVPESVNKFTVLTDLDLSNNMLQGTVSERHFSNLSRLTTLSLDNNQALVLNFSAHWFPPFQLDYIYLRNCKVGPSFPKWLITQKNFTLLYLTNTGISDSIPAAFWNSLSPRLMTLDLSKNEIHGTLPNFSTEFYNTASIDLSSNYLEGAIPSFPTNVSTLSLANNKLSNSIPFLCPRTKMMLTRLDLSNNLLSGKLPDCWMNFDQLYYLDLGNNNFTGDLPTSIGALNWLQVLSLRNNSFQGELAISLQNFSGLYIFDISHNSLSGHIPSTIGSTLETIVVLSLRNNKFEGKLPLSLCQLSGLHVMDLSANHISGTIPECIYKLQAMTDVSDLGTTEGQEAVIMWKTKEQIFGDSLAQLKYIAISDNELEGQIPSVISSLKALASLDLARNKLTGNIPSNIGQLTTLQFLDLSSNHLSGSIPASLADVTSLGMLDLSNNNLSGRIPKGTQLQSFDPSNYSGNPLLCGTPLPKCPGDQTFINRTKGDNIPIQEENDSDDLFPGLYISAVLGFITGFWGVCGSSVLKRSWRHACFYFFDDVKDRVYVMFALRIARVRRRKQEVDQ